MERRVRCVFVILRGTRNIARKITARTVCLLCTAHPPTWNMGTSRRRKTKSFYDLPRHRCLRRPSILSLAITPSGSKLPFFVESSSFLPPRTSPVVRANTATHSFRSQHYDGVVFFSHTPADSLRTKKLSGKKNRGKKLKKEIPLVRLPSVDDFTHIALP